MGTVRNLPAYMSAMASDISVGTPFFATTVAGDFSPPESAPFFVSSWQGKTNYTPMSPNIGGNQGGSGASTSNTFSLACAPNGGQAPYSYAWTLFSVAGTGTAAFSGPTTNQTAFAVLNVTGGLGANVNCSVKCTVTDALSNVVASNTITLSWTFT